MQPPPTPFCVVISGLVLPTLTNQREHWSASAKRARIQRPQTAMLVGAAISKMKLEHRERLKRAFALEGVLVLLTRFAVKLADHGDGEATAMKHVRDGVADAFALDDGSKKWTWRYAQEVSSQIGAKVEVWPRERCLCCGQDVPGPWA